MNEWRIHACFADRECRIDGAPPRMYLFTPWGSLVVAVSLTRSGWTQAWLPRLGYQEWWSPIVWHPKDRKER